jgi:class 3 adenylate cyclase
VRPETRYVTTSDGAYVAYQTIGDGPIDIVWQFEWIGNVDTVWEFRPFADWFRGLASFSRLILHDRRGTGASSRNVTFPNLETRVADLRAVLRAVDSERAVLGGTLEGGAPNVLFAATAPERVHSLFWWYPAPRTTQAADYPFGATDELLARAGADTREHWGTDRYGTMELQPFASETEPFPWGFLTRQTATPDAAAEMDHVYNQTDVRGAMPAINVPVLLMARDRDREALSYLASLLRYPTVRLFPGEGAMKVGEQAAVLDAIRAFVGAEPSAPDLDTVLATVVFTDIVDSTQKQAELGDRGWKELVLAHHDIVRRSLSRWRGVENDTAGDGFYATFDGPARGIRCALEVVERVRELGIQVRAGVHTGECQIIDGKAGGIAVSIGARVAAAAGPSEVMVSQTVRDLVAGSGLLFSDAGEHELKGVPGVWHLHRVVSERA